MSSTSATATATAVQPDGTILKIRRPDDFHHHCRDGAGTASVLKHAVPRFTRCLMMPNLKPPVTTVDLAVEYKKRILASMPENPSHGTFQPLIGDQEAARHFLARCLIQQRNVCSLLSVLLVL